MKKLLIVSFILLTALYRLCAQQTDLKQEYATALLPLTEALLKRQITAAHDVNFGAIRCIHCNVLHTRAAEAVYPFAVAYSIKKDPAYLNAAKQAGGWLIRQQQENGSWKETPEEWTGTTTDQLLMMMLAFEKLENKLSPSERTAWKASMQKAAGYLMAVMKPEFASINYVSTTTATLAKAGLLFKNPGYTLKASMLAHRVISKMDADGFINGEGGKSHGNKMGVDLGYDMEMSLWGLGFYARLTNDTLVNNAVRRALRNHLYFIYPDGSMDGSWGIRSNKWTGYGSATSDGCQVLFSLYSQEDPVYAAASLRNLQFLKRNMTGDLIGYGLQHDELFHAPPCIYPTFAKAKNIAMAYELEQAGSRQLPGLPADSAGWLRLFPTLDVIEVRTANFMATITGYRYKDPAGSKGKYMFRPSGGAISHWWLKDHGFLQAAGPTIYTRPEPMSFPEAPGVVCITPRIEYTDTAGYFTNLFEFDSRLSIDSSRKNVWHVGVSGELKDKDQLTGGVGYQMDYLFTDTALQKTVCITWHDAWPVITLNEPFIHFSGMRFEPADDHTVYIYSGKKKLVFRLLSGNATLVCGRNADKYWTPYPALKAFPVELVIKPEPGVISKTITYSISVAE